MATKRRRIGAGLASMGDFLGQWAQVLYKQEQEAAQQERLLERQRVHDERTFAQGLLPKIQSGEIAPDTLSDAVRAILGESVNLDQLTPSFERRAEPIMSQIDAASTINALPTELGVISRLGAAGVNTSPVLKQRYNAPSGGELPSSNFMPTRAPNVRRVTDQLSARRSGILSEEARQRALKLTKVDSVDPTGRAQSRFVPETELAGLGSMFTEPSATQRGGQKQTELLAGDLSPEVTTAKSAQEGSIAAARKRAELQQEAARLGLTSQQQAAALALADNFTQESKDYFTIARSFRQMTAVTNNPSAAGDLALITSYMKSLDPGSTVREGEFANAQNASGVPTMIRNIYNRAMSGERLAPEQRKDFITQAGAIYKAAVKEHRQRVDIYKRRSAQMSVPAFLVVQEGDPELFDDAEGRQQPGASPVLPVPSHSGTTRRFEITNIRPAGSR